MRLYGDGYHNGSHIPFNFELINNLNKDSKAIDYKNIIDLWLTNMPYNVEANWVVSTQNINYYNKITNFFFLYLNIWYIVRKS